LIQHPLGVNLFSLKEHTVYYPFFLLIMLGAWMLLSPFSLVRHENVPGGSHFWKQMELFPARTLDATARVGRQTIGRTNRLQNRRVKEKEQKISRCIRPKTNHWNS